MGLGMLDPIDAIGAIHNRAQIQAKILSNIDSDGNGDIDTDEFRSADFNFNGFLEGAELGEVGVNPDWERFFFVRNIEGKYTITLDLRNVDLSGADLSGADLSGASLNMADLSYANLVGANLERAQFVGTSLRHANLSGANLNFSIIYPMTTFFNSDLSGATLIGTYISAAHFENANLSRANLSAATIYGGNFRVANFSGASLVGVEFLRGDDLVPLRTDLAIFSNANLTLSKGIRIRPAGTAAKNDELSIEVPVFPGYRYDGLCPDRAIYGRVRGADFSQAPASQGESTQEIDLSQPSVFSYGAPTANFSRVPIPAFEGQSAVRLSGKAAQRNDPSINPKEPNPYIGGLGIEFPNNSSDLTQATHLQLKVFVPRGQAPVNLVVELYENDAGEPNNIDKDPNNFYLPKRDDDFWKVVVKLEPTGAWQTLTLPLASFVDWNKLTDNSCPIIPGVNEQHVGNGDFDPRTGENVTFQLTMVSDSWDRNQKTLFVGDKIRFIKAR